MTFNFDEFDKHINESLARPHGPALNQSFPCVDNDGKKRLEVEDIKPAIIPPLNEEEFYRSATYVPGFPLTLPDWLL